MDHQKNTNIIVTIIILLVIALGAWLITKSLKDIEEPTIIQEPEVSIEDIVVVEEPEDEIQVITETSSSTDLSDIEADLNFNFESSLDLGDFE